MKLREFKERKRFVRPAEILTRNDNTDSDRLNETLGVTNDLKFPEGEGPPYFIVEDLILLFPEQRERLLEAVEWGKLKTYCEAPFDSSHSDQLNVLFFIKRFNPGLFHTIQIPKEKIREYKQALRNLVDISSLQSILTLLTYFEGVFPKEKMGKERWLTKAEKILFEANESNFDFELAYFYIQLNPQDREKVRDIVVRNLDSLKQKALRSSVGEKILKIRKLARLKVLLAKEIKKSPDGEIEIIEKPSVTQSPELPVRPNL